MDELLKVNQLEIASNYPDKAFALKHQLVDHPLLQIPRLLELARILPEEQIEYYTGKVDVGQDKKKTTPTGLSVEETIQQIKYCESWLVLKRVELVDEYSQLVDDLLSQIKPSILTKTSGATAFRGWIFITSPQSISPYHIDPEYNLLLQIRGNKTIHVFDQLDRSIISEQELETYYSAGRAKSQLEFKEEYQEKAKTFVMKPGDGVYVPVSAPHWVKVEDDVSVSMSFTFYSPEIHRRARLFKLNHLLRSRGLNPTPVGRSAVRDAAKYAGISSIIACKRLFGYK
jgi:hypothetical protein